jgi:rare lipoprotein A
MGTWIRVTNRENGRVLSMRVNDRGPYAKGRILDLSKAAAIRLGLYKKGTALVRIEVLRWPSSVRPEVGLRPFVQYVVQVAAYPDPKQAWRELKRFRRAHGWVAFSLDRRPSGLMGIIAGPFDDKQRALNISRRLKKSGARPLVRRYRK